MSFEHYFPEYVLYLRQHVDNHLRVCVDKGGALGADGLGHVGAHGIKGGLNMQMAQVLQLDFITWISASLVLSVTILSKVETTYSQMTHWSPTVSSSSTTGATSSCVPGQTFKARQS